MFTFSLNHSANCRNNRFTCAHCLILLIVTYTPYGRVKNTSAKPLSLWDSSMWQAIVCFLAKYNFKRLVWHKTFIELGTPAWIACISNLEQLSLIHKYAGENAFRCFLHFRQKINMVAVTPLSLLNYSFNWVYFGFSFTHISYKFYALKQALIIWRRNWTVWYRMMNKMNESNIPTIFVAYPLFSRMRKEIVGLKRVTAYAVNQYCLITGK